MRQSFNSKERKLISFSSGFSKQGGKITSTCVHLTPIMYQIQAAYLIQSSRYLPQKRDLIVPFDR